jgi:hypothetical protein
MPGNLVHDGSGFQGDAAAVSRRAGASGGLSAAVQASVLLTSDDRFHRSAQRKANNLHVKVANPANFPFYLRCLPVRSCSMSPKRAVFMS